jgi:nicotinate phosphoribosyltransferase
MQYLTVEVRKALDAAGLPKAFITVSNDLDESIIQQLRDDGAPINSWGVGTQMVTGGYGGPYSSAAFTGVYKMMAKEDVSPGAVADTFIPTMKFSDNPEKTTTPGIKQVWRLSDDSGKILADILALDRENGGGGEPFPQKGETAVFWHTSADYRHFTVKLETEPEPLLKQWVKDGTPCRDVPPLQQAQETMKREMDHLDGSYKRIINPHIYKVSMTGDLRELKRGLIKKQLGEL